MPLRHLQMPALLYQSECRPERCPLPAPGASMSHIPHPTPQPWRHPREWAWCSHTGLVPKATQSPIRHLTHWTIHFLEGRTLPPASWLTSTLSKVLQTQGSMRRLWPFFFLLFTNCRCSLCHVSTGDVLPHPHPPTRAPRPGQLEGYPEGSWSCSACTMFLRLASAKAWVKCVYGAMKQ